MTLTPALALTLSLAQTLALTLTLNPTPTPTPTLTLTLTLTRYNTILTAHMEQWQAHKMEYDEAHRLVASKKREAEHAEQLLAAEQSTRAKQAPRGVGRGLGPA